MFTDLVLCNDYFSDLGFDSVVNVNPVEFVNKHELKKRLFSPGLKVVLGCKDNRAIVEMKQIDVLLSPEKGVRRDSLHHRNSGLNHVICKLARKNGIAMGFSFNEVLMNRGLKRAVTLGRMMQNVRLCRKYKLRMVLGSFARTKWGMRAADDLISFGIVIGMHPAEAKRSLEVVDVVLKEKKDRKYVLAEGVKILK
ncbi:MAG: hypothetical protein ISS23_03315 [Nanoarchaeota archaeon]|nr:hypothetical protein [Nanoarchaeota archaeon]